MSPVPLATLVQNMFEATLCLKREMFRKSKTVDSKQKLNQVQVLQNREGKDLTPTRPIEPGTLYPRGGAEAGT